MYGGDNDEENGGRRWIIQPETTVSTKTKTITSHNHGIPALYFFLSKISFVRII